MKKRGKMNAKSQITIFVIIALILVVSIALAFVFMQPPAAKISAEKPDTTRAYIADCLKDSFEDVEKIVISHGGFLELTNADSVKFSGKDVLWLCYTSKYEQVCTNKHPMLRVEIEKEIISYVKPQIEKCFLDIKSQLNDYDYKENELVIEANILPRKVYFNITKELSYNIKDRVLTLNNFDSSLNSVLYDFVRLSTEVSNQEVRGCDCSKTCNADLYQINKENQDFSISKNAMGGDGEEIYVIKETSTAKKFNFAVRNCVRAPITS